MSSKWTDLEHSPEWLVLRAEEDRLEEELRTVKRRKRELVLARTDRPELHMTDGAELEESVQRVWLDS